MSLRLTIARTIAGPNHVVLTRGAHGRFEPRPVYRAPTMIDVMIWATFAIMALVGLGLVFS